MNYFTVSFINISGCFYINDATNDESQPANVVGEEI